jgi:mycofactocin system glycosyltransferase
MTYRLSAQVELRTGTEGPVLVAQRPLRLLRLNSALQRLLSGGDDGVLKASNDAERRALETLVEKGFLERLDAIQTASGSLPHVSVIIPVKDRAGELRSCLNSLMKLDYPADKLEVIVVDDGSSDGTRDVAGEFRALVTDSGGVGLGPAAARNRGAAIAEGEILAFIDSDCTASENWLQELVPAFQDPQVAAIGGWVDGFFQASVLDRYEAVMSSLNLGRRERSGREGADTFYLPSCNLLVRRQAFRSAGGFRAEMKVGEDVDLTWRLRDAGGKILYRPQGTVWHAHRNRLSAFLKRRFEYGTSEGLLQKLHPQRMKFLTMPPVLLLQLALLGAALGLLSWLPLPLFALVLTGDAIRVRGRLARQGIALSCWDVLLARGRAVTSLAYYLGFHLLRYYLVPQLLIVALFPQAALPLGALALWVCGVEYHVRRPRISPLSFLFFSVMEHLFYGLGVVEGCLRQKTFASYRFRLRPLPA